MSAAGGCESFPACVCVEMCRAIWVLSVNHVFVFFSELQTLNFQYKVSTEQKKKKKKKHVGKPFSTANRDSDAHTDGLTIARKDRGKKKNMLTII